SRGSIEQFGYKMAPNHAQTCRLLRDRGRRVRCNLAWRAELTPTRSEAHDEHSVVGPAGTRRARVLSIGHHEDLHVRQDKRGGPVLWCVAPASVDVPRYP